MHIDNFKRLIEVAETIEKNMEHTDRLLLEVNEISKLYNDDDVFIKLRKELYMRMSIRQNETLKYINYSL